MKKNVKIGLFIVVVITICAVIYMNANAPIDVETVTLAKSDMVMDFKETAVISSEQTEIYASDYPAKVLDMADAGSKVKKDAVLYTLDTAELEKKKREIELQIEVLKGQKDMTSGGFYTDKQQDGADAYYDNQIEILNMTLKDLDEKIAHAVVKAPFDGVITNVYVKSGAYVNTGAPVLEFASTEKGNLVATCDVLSSQVTALEEKQTVKLTENSDNDAKTYDGEIQRIADCGTKRLSSLGLEEQKFTVTITAPALDDLSIGSDIDAVFETMHLKDKLTLPKTAVFKRDGKDAVWIVKEDALAIKDIELGVDTDYDYEVLSGLAMGDIIVVNADNENLTEGKRVK